MTLFPAMLPVRPALPLGHIGLQNSVLLQRMLRFGNNEQELQTLLAEARKLLTLRGHSNIVQIREVFEEEGEGFLVMEYVDGSTLEDILERHIQDRGWLPIEQALDYFTQILEGLLFAHSNALYHRDLKPSNILVSKLEVVKIVDFGLARPMAFKSADYEHHPTGLPWTGTPNFMSPEQAKGEALDHQTDIFSA